MKIKSIILAIAVSVSGCLSLAAQTPEEIVKNMSALMERTTLEGYTMDLVMKMPIVGEMRSHNLVLGEKMRIEVNSSDKSTITWENATTEWVYDKKAGVVTISNRKPSVADSDGKSTMSSFENITSGYDLTLQSETADAWYILCKKKKSNKVKDDPKKMDLAVSKKTNLPLYLRMKKSVVSVALENVTIGVSEDKVTFNPDNFPNVRIVDNR